MAYARKGERGSAVYLWTDGECWYCDGCDLPEQRGRTIALPKRQENFGALGYHLLQHVAIGQHVPDEVFDRLRAEMDGEVYVTDVMRALPDEAIVAHAREDVANGATHDCGEWVDPLHGRCALCGRLIEAARWHQYLLSAAGECECRTRGCGHKGRIHNGPNGECQICQKACWA